jgi:hypothetical protein
MKKTRLIMLVLLTLIVGLNNVQATETITICTGDTVTLGGAIPGGYLYAWNTGATTPSIVVAPTVNTVYSRTVLNTSFAIILQDTFSVIVKTRPFVTISSSGGNVVCIGGSVQLIANSNPSPIHYLWNTGDTTMSIIASPISSPTLYTVVGTTNGCSSTASFALSIQAPPTAYTLTGNSSYCSNEFGVVMGLSGSEANCNYALYHNGSVVSIGVGTGNAISFGMIANASGVYTAMGFTNTLGCSAQMNGSLTVSVDPLPGAAGTISGPSLVCQNTTHGFSTPVVPYASSYIWSVPTEAIIVSGQGTPMIMVYFNGTASGQIAVFGQNDCGTGQASFLAVNVNLIPNLTISTPDPDICVGGSTSLTASTPATSYLWSTGETSQTIIVSPSTTTMYTVLVTGPTGCSANAWTTISVQQPPAVNLSLVQDHFCTDVNSALLSGGSPAGGSYSGTGVFYGTTFYPPVVRVGTYLVTYTYTNGFGCSASATDLLTINPVPAVMFTNVTTGIHTDTPAFDLMSYVSPRGGTFFGPGMVGSFFYPALAGSGTHMITYTYTHPITGCFATQIQYLPVGPLGLDEDPGTENTIVLFPNPTRDILYLRGIDNKEIQGIRIVNVLGKVVYTTETISHEMEISVAHFASGTYIISFLGADGISTSKYFMKH